MSEAHACCVICFSGVETPVLGRGFKNMRAVARWARNIYGSTVKDALWVNHGVDGTGIMFRTWLDHVRYHVNAPVTRLATHMDKLTRVSAIARTLSVRNFTSSILLTLRPDAVIASVQRLIDEFDEKLGACGIPRTNKDFEARYGRLVEIQNTEIDDILGRVEYIMHS